MSKMEALRNNVSNTKRNFPTFDKRYHLLVLENRFSSSYWPRIAFTCFLLLLIFVSLNESTTSIYK
jgi:hypothetical protein